MISAVVFISVGKPSHANSAAVSSSSSQDESSEYLVLAIATALLTGVILTINAIVLRHYVKYIHISPLQLNFDGGLIQMAVLMVLFFIYVREHGMYEWFDFCESIFASLLSMAANITLSQAFAIGLGGPVQGINNLMSVVQTVMAALILSQIPSLMQNIGLVLGLVGALVMCGVDKIFWSKE